MHLAFTNFNQGQRQTVPIKVQAPDWRTVEQNVRRARDLNHAMLEAGRDGCPTIYREKRAMRDNLMAVARSIKACQFEVLGFFEELTVDATGKSLGSRPVTRATRQFGSAGQIEYDLTENTVTTRGLKEITTKASPANPVRVRSVFQMLCGRLKEERRQTFMAGQTRFIEGRRAELGGQNGL
jgi:hypothetical protein